jgi:uncharacterized protein
MDKLVIASTCQGAGKTGTILGLTKALGKSCGYIKPFGDRMLYSKKRLWDHDAMLLATLLGIKENPEDITLGFEHAKLKFMYDEESSKKKLIEVAAKVGKDKDILFVEGGRDVAFGSSVNLDPISIAKALKARLLVVMAGREGVIVDDIAFLKKYVNTKGIDLAGVIINKIQDPKDFKDTYMDSIKELDIPVLGVMPFEPELTYMTAEYLADATMAKVIAGETGLGNKIKNIFVGAMSASTALRDESFKKDNILLITRGDRYDLILAALEIDTAAILLTNGHLPPANIISQASEKGVPVLLMNQDTFQVSKKVDDLEPLITKRDTGKMEILEKAVKANIDLKMLK